MVGGKSVVAGAAASTTAARVTPSGTPTCLLAELLKERQSASVAEFSSVSKSARLLPVYLPLLGKRGEAEAF